MLIGCNQSAVTAAHPQCVQALFHRSASAEQGGHGGAGLPLQFMEVKALAAYHSVKIWGLLFLCGTVKTGIVI